MFAGHTSAPLHVLEEVLYQALYIPPGHNPFPRDVILQPELAKYIANWQLDRDLGYKVRSHTRTNNCSIARISRSRNRNSAIN